MADPRSALEELRAPFQRGGDHAIHLNNAGVSPMTARAELALADVAALMRTGTSGVPALLARYAQARATFARLLHASAHSIAFFQTCAVAISQMAAGIPLRNGDEILLPDQEYPSNAYPWHRAAERAGARVIVAPSRDDFSIDMEQFLARIGPRTRVVAFSWVQFQTGTVIDISAVVAAARRVHAWVVVDGIQGLGAMPFDFEASGVDAICGGTHKWLLGPLGLGFFALRHERIAELEPLLYGAFTYGTSEDAVDPTRRPRMDAKRFEPGTPLVLSAVPSAASLELLLEIGLDHVATEALTLRMIVEKEARTRGYGVRPHGSITSPIITIIPRTSPAALQTELSRRGISVAVRAGGLRISPHAHNEPRHIDALFAALDELDR